MLKNGVERSKLLMWWKEDVEFYAHFNNLSDFHLCFCHFTLFISSVNKFITQEYFLLSEPF